MKVFLRVADLLEFLKNHKGKPINRVVVPTSHLDISWNFVSSVTFTPYGPILNYPVDTWSARRSRGHDYQQILAVNPFSVSDLINILDSYPNHHYMPFLLTTGSFSKPSYYSLFATSLMEYYDFTEDLKKGLTEEKLGLYLYLRFAKMDIKTQLELI